LNETTGVKNSSSIVITDLDTPEPAGPLQKMNENSTRWIQIDAIGKHYTKDVFKITGTTNLDGGEQLEFFIYPETVTPTEKYYGGAIGVISPVPQLTTVINGSGGVNTWSIDLNPIVAGTWHMSITKTYQSLPDIVKSAQTSFVVLASRD
jgi:hypothetical protein